jgi:hypothetical protein
MTTAIELEQLRKLEKIVIRAREGGHTDALAKAALLLGQIIRAYHPEPPGDDVRPDRAEPHDARAPACAHARETGQLDDRQLDGLHKLRKGRDQCGATTRNGGRCQAPAIEGHYVCRRHGGGAPQVALKAEYTGNLMRVYTVHREYEEARGTAREFDALCEALQATRDLEAYQIKLRLLRELKAGLKQRKAVPQPDTAD